jgi:hypothetical protein
VELPPALTDRVAHVLRPRLARARSATRRAGRDRPSPCGSTACRRSAGRPVARQHELGAALGLDGPPRRDAAPPGGPRLCTAPLPATTGRWCSLTRDGERAWAPRVPGSWSGAAEFPGALPATTAYGCARRWTDCSGRDALIATGCSGRGRTALSPRPRPSPSRRPARLRARRPADSSRGRRSRIRPRARLTTAVLRDRVSLVVQTRAPVHPMTRVRSPGGRARASTPPQPDANRPRDERGGQPFSEVAGVTELKGTRSRRRSGSTRPAGPARRVYGRYVAAGSSRLHDRGDARRPRRPPVPRRPRRRRLGPSRHRRHACGASTR